MAEYLNLALVHSLQVLLSEGSFRAASLRLHITPPAMTQQIKRLEVSLGFEVVKRGVQPVTLTVRGEAFMVHARESLEASWRATGMRVPQQLRIGFINGYPRGQNEDFLVRFRQSQPDVQLQFVQLNWGEQISKLLSGEVDASLARPPFRNDDDLEHVRVHREPRVAAVPADSPLAAKGSLLLEDLERFPHLRAEGIDFEWSRYWAVDPRPNGAPVRYGAWASTMEEALTAIATAENMMITAASVAERYSHPGVAYLPVDDAEYCEVRLCIRSGESRDHVRALMQSVHHGEDRTRLSARKVG